MLAKIIFFNHAHNGDVFSGKGYLQDIIKQLPYIQFNYIHILNPKVMLDLKAPFLDAGAADFSLGSNFGVDIVDRGDTLFVNTWVGVYHRHFLNGECHGNYQTFQKMYRDIYNSINARLGEQKIIFSDNQLEYIASTDFSVYETQKADSFLSSYSNSKIHLFCNSQVRSFQSNLGTLPNIIETIAKKYSEDVFICTSKFETLTNNIFFTDDILQLENDINEIAYISTKANTVIGMNSGPYMFTHLKENLMNPNKVFLSLSHRSGDSYTAHMQGFDCNYLHHSTDDESSVISALEKAIRLEHHEDIKNNSKGKLLVI